MNIPGFKFECEVNDSKRRVGVYLKDSIKYTRCWNLEGQNAHIIIIDLESEEMKKKESSTFTVA